MLILEFLKELACLIYPIVVYYCGGVKAIGCELVFSMKKVLFFTYTKYALVGPLFLRKELTKYLFFFGFSR